MITKDTGHWIINGSAYTADDGGVISAPDDAVCDEFDTEEAMLAEHQRRFPEQYDTDG